MGADHVIDQRKPLDEELKGLGIAPRYVASHTHIDQHLSSIMELIASRCHMALIDDPDTLDNVPMKMIVATFIDDVLVNGLGEKMTDDVSAEIYTQHSTQVADGIAGVMSFIQQMAGSGTPMVYKYVYRILRQGNFVVSYCLAQLADEDVAVFDLFRLDGGLIAEHWDSMEPLPHGDMLVNQGEF